MYSIYIINNIALYIFTMYLYQIIYYILQSGRSLLHEIMSAMASLCDARSGHFYYILEFVERVIGAGADVNVIDKVSYREAPYYNNQVLL